ncbi:MAG TPA: response regulator [Fimbriimonas sp.]|nr:response regulator [Fimbriimonas sp.]
MPKRILITDDALFMRITLKRILTAAGFEVVGEASSGAESVALYQDLKPDLVTMDITMPEMDGIEALKAIKSEDPSAVVVMCSALGQQNLMVEAMQAGAKEFITKPFQAEKVVEVIKRHAA